MWYGIWISIDIKLKQLYVHEQRVFTLSEFLCSSPAAIRTVSTCTRLVHKRIASRKMKLYLHIQGIDMPVVANIGVALFLTSLDKSILTLGLPMLVMDCGVRSLLFYLIFYL